MSDTVVVCVFGLCAMSLFLCAFSLGSAAVIVAIKGWPAVNPFPAPRRQASSGNPFPLRPPQPLLDPAPGPMPQSTDYVDEEEAIREYEQFKKDIMGGKFPDVEMLEA